MTTDTWALIMERKNLKDTINQTQDLVEKQELHVRYWETNKEVKCSAGRDKRRFIEELTVEAETAADQRNIKRLYEITRALSGKNSNPSRSVKDKNKNAITTEDEQRARWTEHFKEILNRPAPPIPPPTQLLDKER